MQIKRMSLLLLFLIAIFFAGYGFMVGKKNWPPYYLLKSINQNFFQSNSDSKTLKELTSEKGISFIETTLLPLSYDEFNFGNIISDSSTSSGALAIFKDKIFILNKHRQIFILNVNSKENFSFYIEDLNDNNNDFFKKYKKDLRIHDLLVKEISGQYYLIISHEKYHDTSDQNSLNISYLLLNKDLNVISNDWKSIHQGTKVNYPEQSYSSGGGQLADLDEENFLLANGDYTLDGWLNELNENVIAPPQDIDSTLGKIIKINLLNYKTKIISYGHRNPQGLSISSSGRILQAEHGPNGGDEINLINLNTLSNHGWPYQSLGTQYDDFSAPVDGVAGSHKGFKTPLFSFVPSIGISEITEIEGFNERWDEDILVASLKSRSMYRLRLVNGSIIYSEPIWVGERIRDIKQVGNRIFLWLDNQNLRIYKVAKTFFSSSGRHASQTELHTLLSNCLQCHHIGPTNPNHSAPSLTGLFDRPIGSDDGFQFYSNSLFLDTDYWSSTSMKNFIINPQDNFPGSSMPASSLRYTESELDQIIDLLEVYSFKSAD